VGGGGEHGNAEEGKDGAPIEELGGWVRGDGLYGEQARGRRGGGGKGGLRGSDGE